MVPSLSFGIRIEIADIENFEGFLADQRFLRNVMKRGRGPVAMHYVEIHGELI